MSFISVPGTEVRPNAGPIADRSQNTVSVQRANTLQCCKAQTQTGTGPLKTEVT